MIPYFIILSIVLIILFFINGLTPVGEILAKVISALFNLQYTNLSQFDILHYTLTILIFILILVIYIRFLSTWKEILKNDSTKEVIFSPAYLFSFAALIFFLISFLPIRVAKTGKDFIPSTLLILIFFIALIFFLIGCCIANNIFVDKKREYLIARLYYRLPKLSFLIPFTLWFSSLSLGIYLFIKKGIPILGPQIRGWSIDAFTNGFLDLQIALLFFLPRIRSKLLQFLLPTISIFFFIFKGVRYQLMIIAFALVLYYSLTDKINFKKAGIAALAVSIIIFSTIGLLKHVYISSEYENQFNNKITATLFQPYSASVSTFKNMERLLNEVMPRGIFHGSLIWDTIRTLLPGKQTASSTILSRLVIDQYSGYKSSSSLHFSSFAYMAAELGTISVALYSILFGFYLTYFYNIATSNNTLLRKKIYSPAYCILFAMFIAGLPTTVFRSYWILAFILSPLLLIPTKEHHDKKSIFAYN